MIVRSHNPEFGYELISTLPYAYALHLRGELEGTISGTGSEALYYFSPHHEIDPTPRDFAHSRDAAPHIPNTWIHQARLKKQCWVPPPYKQHYAPSAIRFDKPTVVIYNRYNKEWGLDPINYFDLDTLRKLFSLLDEYQVVYFNVRGREELEDNAHSMDLGDYEMIRQEFPQVQVIHDIVERHGGDYNEVQLRIFAGCEKFITMNGAPCILASYFGGENIIYTRECREIQPAVNSFYNWYHDFGGSDITRVATQEELLRKVEARWARKIPKLNILIRTHGRGGSFDVAWRSIQKQGYDNVRVIASYDDEGSWRYVREYACTKIKVEKSTEHERREKDEEYRSFFPPNLYLNTLMDQVVDGYVLYLDDDDVYPDGALRRIASLVSEDGVLLWRVNCHGRIVPSNENFGKVVGGDISGLGMCFHVKHKHLAQWEPWRRGDYRVAKRLSQHLSPIWVDEVLASTAERIRTRKSGYRKDSRSRKERWDEINALVAERIRNRVSRQP